ncbi:MAG: hypothetical protein ACOVN0_03610 [Niveispirillum sp.]|uniref:hypothetical protein n=1 Tax=Niveispirillum sp. TaxID=1917217 RepID=UPI003BA5609B
MALYQDDLGNLYWHEKAEIDIVPPPPRLPEHNVGPVISRLMPGRTGWLTQGSIVMAAFGLLLTGLGQLIMGQAWPFDIGLVFAAFAFGLWLRSGFISHWCAERVPFTRPVRIVSRQPWQPYLLWIVEGAARAGLVVALGRSLSDNPTPFLQALVPALCIACVGREVWRAARVWIVLRSMQPLASGSR